MTKPNFFIVGAPKSGTTSLTCYLSDHPQVFMPTVKEPNFFAGQFLIDARRVTLHPYLASEQHYLALFRDANEQKAIGEASANYLRFPEALEGIRDFNPSAKIIVMLRNPVDLVQALHAQLLYELRETERDFAQAWRLQADRQQGRQLPDSRLFCDDLLYGRMAKVGEQLERLLQIFPRNQVHIILFEEFVRDTRNTYLEVLDFLNIQRDKRSDFPKHNERRTHKLRQVSYYYKRMPVPVKLFAARVRQTLGVESFGVNRFIKTVNTRPAVRAQLNSDILRLLEEYFREDINRLEHLLVCDLSHWRPHTKVA